MNRRDFELDIEHEYREKRLKGEQIDPEEFLDRYDIEPEEKHHLLKRIQKWEESMEGFQEYYESIDHDSNFRNILKEVRKSQIIQIPPRKVKKTKNAGSLAASNESEMKALRGTIGAVFNTRCPIKFLDYDTRLYIEDENSLSLEFEKGSQTTCALDGKTVNFSLKGAELNYSDEIRDGEVIIDFGKLGATIRDYRDLVIKINLEDATVEIHLDKFEVKKGPYS